MSRVYGERYELQERIASGAEGELWRGTDRIGQTTVAIKVMRSAQVDQRAAAVLAEVNHPNIVRIQDFGVDYVVMEYVAGQQFSPESALTTGVLRMLAQLAEALRVVHAAGAAHGDIQLRDLIVRPDGTVVLIGFRFTAPLATAAAELDRLGKLAAECLSGLLDGAEFAQRAGSGSFTSFSEFAQAALAEAERIKAHILATFRQSGPPPQPIMPPSAPIAAAPPPPPAHAPAAPAPQPAPSLSNYVIDAPGGLPTPPAMPSVTVGSGVRVFPVPPPQQVRRPAQPAQAQPARAVRPTSSATFTVSVGYPKRVAKGRASAFLVQIHLPKEQAAAAQRLLETFGENASGSVSTDQRLRLGQDVVIALASPDVEFSAPKNWTVSPRGIGAAFYGRPSELARPGAHVGILTIIEAASGRELASMPFTISIADFALGKISRPTLRGVLTGVAVLGSVAVVGYSMINQVQEVIGIVIGTIGAAISAVVTVRTTALYTRKTAGSSKSVAIG